MKRIGLLVVALLLALAVVTVPASGPVFVGSATSDSMAPTIGAGDAYLVVPSDGLETGDIVTFRAPERGGYVTHRIVEDAEGGFITKGDASERTDQAADLAPVTSDAVVGEVAVIAGNPVVVPSVGGALSAIREYELAIIALLVGLGIVLSVRDRSRDRPGRSLLRVGDVVPPILLGAFVLLVAVFALAPSAHVVSYTVTDTGGETTPDEQITETVTLNTASSPLTRTVVRADGASIKGHSSVESGRQLTLGIDPEERARQGIATVSVARYPVVLPRGMVGWFHDIHPILASIVSALSIVGPLAVFAGLLLDGQQPLRNPSFRTLRGGS